MTALFNARMLSAQLVAAFWLTIAFILVTGQAHAQAAASNWTSGVRYDLAGRTIGKITPDPDGAGALKFAAVRSTYNDFGELTKVETGELASWQSEALAPASWSGFTVFRTVEFTYNPGGQKLTERVKGSDLATVSLTQYSYDASGRLECTTIRMNPAAFDSLPSSACALGTQGTQGPDRIMRNNYDAVGQLLQVRKAVGTNLEQAYATYTYTPNGKQQFVIDANGNKAKMEYDGFDRQTKWIFPSLTKPAFNPATPATALSSAGALSTEDSSPDDYEQYAYDPNGNRTTLIKRDGSMITYQYDALNRMTLKSVPFRANLPATHRRNVFYNYDLRGLMTGARFDSPGGEGITTEYDGFGRITASTIALDGQSRPLNYQYDNNGNRTRVTYPDGNDVRYTYDALNRPQSVTANAADWMRSYSYNQRGELTGDTVSGNAGSTSFGRDAIGRLSSHARTIPGNVGFNASTTFGYNSASQITSEARTTDSYAYTARENLDRSFTSNGLNQYSAVSGVAHCYDANGNLTADGTYVYLYDIENRLVESHDKLNNNCPSAATDYGGATRSSLRYDPMGRLYETIGGGITTRFLIDGDAMVGEYDAAGVMQRRYVHGAMAGADDPIAWYEGSAMNNATPLRHLYANQQGSIVLAADAAGSGIRQFAYDEYGAPQSKTAFAAKPEQGGRFLYTGQALIPELGMYYYKARMYSWVLGRFMQTDPIGYKDQVNLYAYVANDPVNRTDPTGLKISCTDEKTCGAVAADINKLTKGTYAFNSKGQLYRASKTGGEGKSGTYDRRLGQAIAAKPTISIRVSDTNTRGLSITGPAGGGQTEGPRGNATGANYTVTVTGRGWSGFNQNSDGSNPRLERTTSDQILAHELAGHAIPSMIGGGSGNAVREENVIMRENGRTNLRYEDPDHVQ